MKIRPKILKYQTGNPIKWYEDIYEDYNPYEYESVYDTERGLVAGDLRNGLKRAWSSNIAGTDPGRYNPTNLPNYNQFGKNFSHYKYASGVEEQPYYKDFGNALVDSNGNLTSVGLLWAKDVDKLLPEGHPSRLLNPDGTLKNSWTVKLNDAHGRTPVVRTYTRNQLKEFIDHLRNDLTIGARHNVYLKRGKRYFFVDDDGIRHWVNPNKIGNYQVSKDPVEYGWGDNDNTYWEDYELTGPLLLQVNNPNPEQQNDNNQQNPEEDKKGGSGIDSSHKEGGYRFDWKTLGENLQKRLPGFLEAGRLAGNLWNNSRVYKESLAGIRPNLMSPYLTHRQVVGDEATKQAYYRRAAQGETKAARPITSDADKQIAYLMEAKRVGDEMRAQGDLADNQEIRRTSDESNQHEWANTQRRTEIANANIASINNANALKHNLRAQKYAADWTSIDNYLKGISTRYRQRLAEDRAYADQIWMLLLQHELETDNELQNLKKEASDAIDKNAPDALEKLTKYKNKLHELQLEMYRRMLDRRNSYPVFFGEKGFKVKYTKKDDLLYKSTRDAVEHFRKMSKISSDALNRRPVKIQKLTSHPKGNTRKYLLGGVAPFTIYTPAVAGGETTTTSNPGVLGTSVSSKSSSKKEGSDVLDMVKELFKQLAGNGLPSDVNGLYLKMLRFLAKSEAFGNDLSTDDIASMYLQLMQELNTIKYLKANYDNAEKAMIANNAVNEVAIDFAGRLIGQNKEGEITYAESLSDAKEKGVTPLTNGQLLRLRAVSPQLAGLSLLDDIVANGIGMSKIGEFLKSQLPTLGSSEQTIEGYSKEGSDDIITGLRILESSNGNYKHSNYNKNLQSQAMAALNYLKGILPQNMRKVIEVHAELGGLTEDELIVSLINSRINEGSKSSSKSTNGSGAGGGLDTDMTPEIAFFMGMGDREDFIMADKTMDGLKIKSNSMPITDKDHHNLPNATLEDVSKGSYGGLYDQRNITMGGVKISTTGLSDVLITGGRIYSAELPIDKKAYKDSGIIKPDLRFLQNIEAAEEDVRKHGIVDRSKLTNEQILIINQIYSNHQLPIIYTSTSDGPQLTSEYRRFAIMHGQATENAFEGDLTFNNSVEKIKDDRLRSQFENTMKSVKGDDKYSISDGASAFGWHLWGGDDIYKGTIFIPMSNSTLSALAGTGYKANPSEYMTIDALLQERDLAAKLGYNPAGSASQLK